MNASVEIPKVTLAELGMLLSVLFSPADSDLCSHSSPHYPAPKRKLSDAQIHC